jgi:hypothetical protein
MLKEKRYLNTNSLNINNGIVSVVYSNAHNIE